MTDLETLWEHHRNSDWPRFSSPDQGELMTLDTVISGCVTYHFDSPEGLDSQRRTLLESCLQDLTALMPDIPEDALPYFGQLRDLATALQGTHKPT